MPRTRQISVESLRWSRTLGLWVALGSILCGAPGLARAAENPPAVTAEAHAEFRPDLVDPAYEGFATLWGNVRGLLEAKQWQRAASAAHDAIAKLEDWGFEEAPQLALTLLDAAHRAARAHAAPAARALAGAARRVAPHIPEVHWASVRLGAPPDAGGGARGALGAVSATWQHAPTLIHAAVNSLASAAWVVLVWLTVLALLLLGRYFDLLAHDIGRLLPRRTASIYPLALTAIAIVLPLVAGIGLAYSAILWLVFVAAYLRAAERAMVVVALVVVATLPFVEAGTTRLASFDGTWWEDAWACASGPCGAERRARLHQVASGHSPFASLALGLASLRDDAVRGTPRPMTRILLETSAKVPATATASLRALGAWYALAGTRACREDPSSAEATRAFEKGRELLGDALRRDPGDGATLYDLSRLELEAGKVDDARRRFERAQAAAPDLVARMQARSGNFSWSSCPAGLIPTRHLALPPPRAWAWLAGVWRQPASVAPHAVIPASALWFGAWGAAPLTGAAIAAVVLVVLLSLGGEELGASRHCRRCLGPASRRDGETVVELGVCPACIELEARRVLMDPKEVWLRERAPQRRQQWRERAMRLLTFVAPGTGHLFGGHAFVGSLHGVVWLGALTVLAWPSGFVLRGMPSPLGAGEPLWRAVAGAVLLVVYVLALRGVYTRRSFESVFPEGGG